ncbi:hypothetical protein PJI23_29840, partial [Mycobacterium kansasii]
MPHGDDAARDRRRVWETRRLVGEPALGMGDLASRGGIGAARGTAEPPPNARRAAGDETPDGGIGAARGTAAAAG